jgi:hypothetical protein
MIKELTNLKGYTVEDDYGTMVIYKDDQDFPYCDLATFVFSNYSDENAEKMSRDELVAIIEKSNIEAIEYEGILYISEESMDDLCEKIAQVLRITPEQ